MKYIALIITLILGGILPTRAIEKEKTLFQWKEIGTIPKDHHNDKLGLAGHFACTYHDALYIGGGANFPNTPAKEGGTKKYYTDLFVYKNNQWQKTLKLPYAYAYGYATATNKGIVIVGGENEKGGLNKVVRLIPTEDKVQIEELASLPYPISNMAGGVINNTLIIAGGIQNGKPSSRTWTLDLNNPSSQWVEKASFPNGARVMPAFTTQNGGEHNQLFLFGGFCPSTETSKHQIYTDALSYDLMEDKWATLGNINPLGEERPVALNGASAISYGPSHILFVGGVNYQIFDSGMNIQDQIADAKKRGRKNRINKYQKAYQNYLNQTRQYYKFNPNIYLFNTITKKWTIGDQYPYNPPAVSQIVSWNNELWVINGEQQPGIRNPNIYVATHQNNTSFGWINYTVLFIYLLAMIGLGFYFMKRAQNTDQFFKGGGQIPWWAAGISIFATTLSAITFMAIPAKAFATNWLYIPMAFSIFMIAPVIIRYFLPFFRKLNVTSAYEYLERRFTTSTRWVASAIFIIFMVARIAIVLYLPSLALSTVSGINIYVCILLMSIITMIYCTMGGIEAVIWGDVIQGIILVGGALLSLVILVVQTGGVSKTLDIAMEANKLHAFDFSLDFTHPTFWVIMFGGGLANSFIPYTSDQTLIQRYMTTESPEKAAKSIWLNGIISIPVVIMFYLIGTSLFSFYSKFPQKLPIDMPNTDGIFSHFIMSELPSGVAGLLIAAIFAATMSSLSSNINSAATAFTTDFFVKLKPHSSQKSQLLTAKLSGLLFGTLGLAIALMMVSMNIKSFFDQFNALIGLLSSGLAALFTIGIFFPSIKRNSALVGLIGSLIALLLIKQFTQLNFMLYGLLGIIIAIAIAWVYNTIVPQKGKNIEGLYWKKRTIHQK